MIRLHVLETGDLPVAGGCPRGEGGGEGGPAGCEAVGRVAVGSFAVDAVFGNALEHGLEDYFEFEASELGSDASVDAEAECRVVVGAAVELYGVRLNRGQTLHTVERMSGTLLAD